jgi:hypothetical protein
VAGHLLRTFISLHIAWATRGDNRPGALSTCDIGARAHFLQHLTSAHDFGMIPLPGAVPVLSEERSRERQVHTDTMFYGSLQEKIPCQQRPLISSPSRISRTKA